MTKVCKFGGTSMSSQASIERVAKIIKMDGRREFVIVSAPGKRDAKDIKVTDLLYAAYNEKLSYGRCGEAIEKIRDRFVEIVNIMNLDIDIDTYIDEVEEGINNSTSSDYAASRGEYLSAIVMAKVLNFEFVDAADIVKFNKNGVFDAEYTNDIVRTVLKNKRGVVIPGFYGSTPDGSIKTFSRGGSDVSGAIIARAVNAEVYENWTDVNGFMTTDPRIVTNPLPIEVLSYEELRELSYMGASVLHPDSIFPVKFNNIPINIRNTFEPEYKGTMILSSTAGYAHRPITGIAGKKGNTIILIKKSMMNGELGFGRKVLSVLEHFDVCFEHLPTGIDTMSVVIANSELKDGIESKLIDGIRGKVNPDSIDIIRNLALIAVVGHGMANTVGTAAKLFTSLFEANVNVKMIDQGSSEMNIIIGVEENDCETAIRAIYNAYFG